MKKLLVLLFVCGQLMAQDKTIFTNLTLQNCIDLAYARNQEIKIAKLEEQQAIINKRTSSEIPKAWLCCIHRGNSIQFISLIIVLR
jgi:hypothetical protein